MKLIKKYAGLLLMLTLLVGFTSCEDDEDLEERMFGRVWVWILPPVRRPRTTS